MVFLFEPEIIPTKMIVVDNLLVNQNLIFSLNLRKRNWAEMKMGNDFLVTSAFIKTFPVGSFKQVIEILLRGCVLIIDHGHIF